ncbi:MAG: hypothetical protein RL757_3118 [Bacteroidota bacterium]|jgi:NADH dehydrogenase
MPLNIPDPQTKRVVIVGGGFGGLEIARRLADTPYQVVLLDRNNYHQFQPLFYQVAMAGLEPSSIVFPFRKVLQKAENVLFRVASLQEIFPSEKYVMTEQGRIKYDYLVLAMGADTNFFGNQRIAENSIPMKSVSEALFLRNSIWGDYEKALLVQTNEEQQSLMDIAIVGGGPTGVEIAGALAEMKRDIIPKEYKELNYREIDICLIQSGDKLLNTMSENASKSSLAFLQKLGVRVMLNTQVVDYDGETLTMKDGSTMKSRKLIWAAGIAANPAKGLPESVVTYGKRIKVNGLNQVEGFDNIFAVGDICYTESEAKFPKGHPQVAQVAIQQGKNVAKNLISLTKNRAVKNFVYRDLGSMATVGRHKAVVDLPFWRFQGAFAWFVWLFVHLFAIIGVKNKIFIFLNWLWSYITYDQALRLIIKPYSRKKIEKTEPKV